MKTDMSFKSNTVFFLIMSHITRLFRSFQFNAGVKQQNYFSFFKVANINQCRHTIFNILDTPFLPYCRHKIFDPLSSKGREVIFRRPLTVNWTMWK